MGVVNVTPDSFSDGGLYLDAEKAVTHAQQLLDEGATLIDVGGESTRPGAGVAATGEPQVAARAGTKEPNPSVSEEEERKRVLPVIRDLKRRRPDAIISIDTYKAAVARAAFEAGAEIVNDVSGFRWDPKMAKTLAELKIGAILMHTRGHPEEWRSLPPIGDPVLVVKRDLRQWAESAALAGVKRIIWHSILDLGSASASKKIIPCSHASPNCNKWDIHWWRGHQGNRLSGEPWHATARMLPLSNAFTERWRPR